MKSCAWFLRDGNLKEFTYRLQIDDVGSKSNKKISEIFSDSGWTLVSKIFYANTDTKMGLVFQRSFADHKDWQTWTKTYPYDLVEISSISNRVKMVKSGVGKVHEHAGRPKGRRCGKCGGFGHNARTCKESSVPVENTNDTKSTKNNKKKECKTKIPRRRRRKCGNCNQFGHNSRTCPSVDKK